MIDVERSQPAPPSLVKQTTWSEEDVITALDRDFLHKCYLCEKEMQDGELEVDHRKHRSHFPELQFQWANLFAACHFCNGRRPQTYLDGGLMNPGDGVEARLRQAARLTELSVVTAFSATDESDEEARNTAEELQYVHDPKTATTHRARLKTLALLDAVHDRFKYDVHPVQTQILRAQRRGQAPKERDVEIFRRSVSRKAPYTMLIRSLVDPRLQEYFD